MGYTTPSKNKRSGKSRQNKANQTVALLRMQPVFPPNLNGSMIYPIVLRFAVNSNMTTGLTITRAMLLKTYVVSCITNTVARNWESVKIRKIEMFCVAGLGSSTSQFNSIQIEWLSSYGPSKIVESAGNFEHPAHISSKPPRTSLASFWSLAGSNESESLFRLSGSPTLGNSGTNSPLSVGTVIDLHLEVINQEDTTPVTFSISGGTAGQNYVRSFDDTPLASASFTPASYLQI